MASPASHGHWLRRSAAPRPVPAVRPVRNPPWNPHEEFSRFTPFRSLPRECCTRRVAEDPATPVETLGSLVELFPDEVLANPAWQLAAVADGDLGSRFTAAQAAAAARSPRLDPGAAVAIARQARRPAWPNDAVRFALVARADLPRAGLEALVEGWDRAALGTPVQEIAWLRLCAPVPGAWRHAVAILIVETELRFEISVDAKSFQRWRFVCGLIRSGALPADSPVAQLLATLPRRDVRQFAVEALPPGPARDRLAELCACVSQCLWRRLKEGDILLRAAVRAWNGAGPLEPGPERLRKRVPSSGHRGEPYPESSLARMKWFRFDQVAAPGGSDVPREMRAPSDAEVAEAVGRPAQLDRLCVLASTRCPAQALAAAVRGTCWVDRLCAASNPLASVEQLRLLSGDVHWVVRSAARERLGAA